MNASESQSVFFLKPTQSCLNFSGNEKCIVNYSPLPPKQWLIKGFWIRNPKWKVTARIYGNEYLLSEVKVSPEEGKSFVKIPFFKEDFPLWAAKYTDCKVSILDSSGTLPLYITYKNDLFQPTHSPIDIKNADDKPVRFLNGSVGLPYFIGGKGSINPISYSDAMSEVGELLTKGKREVFYLNCRILDAPVYLKAIIDIGLQNFEVKTMGNQIRFTFSMS